MTKAFIALLLCLAAAACGGGSAPAVSPGPPTAAPSPTGGFASSPASAPAQNGPPDRDLFDLARRYRGLPADAPRVARQTPYDYAIGDAEKFALIDLQAPKITSISARVRYITDHAYFFIQEGVSYSDSGLQRIGSDFESIVYPTVRASFGSEWTPGVDSDTRISILHADLSGAGGFFSSSDEYPRAVVSRSNEREVLYLDSSALRASGISYNALVAHEFQHMINWHADPTEDAWVNEGLSQVAAELVGAGANGVRSFLAHPDTQLNFWPLVEDSAVHYAASQLFFGYLLDHYGGRGKAKDLLAQQADGIAGVDAYLRPFGKTFRDVFADWVIADYLDQADGPFSLMNIDATVQALTTVDSPAQINSTVGQFATEYLDVRDSAPGSTLTFHGAEQVTVGVPDYGGGAFWWSGRGDGIDTRLTREFDLGGLKRATLRFDTWFDAERGWDYAYVAASTDGGQTWRALSGKQTTDYNPVEAAYGPGYTGQSGGWVQEEVDLTEFAGRKVLIRFEYTTDDATSLTGFAVDNVQVPELGFSDKADGDAGWQAEGFRRITGPLHQDFILQKIEGDKVTRVPVDASNHADIPLSGSTVIVISGATEDTTERASFSYHLSSP